MFGNKCPAVKNFVTFSFLFVPSSKINAIKVVIIARLVEIGLFLKNLY